jgi:hypothetical protein
VGREGGDVSPDHYYGDLTVEKQAFLKMREPRAQCGEPVLLREVLPE